jgi:hypothetical protein
MQSAPTKRCPSGLLRKELSHGNRGSGSSGRRRSRRNWYPSHGIHRVTMEFTISHHRPTPKPACARNGGSRHTSVEKQWLTPNRTCWLRQMPSWVHALALPNTSSPMHLYNSHHNQSDLRDSEATSDSQRIPIAPTVSSRRRHNARML